MTNSVVEYPYFNGEDAYGLYLVRSPPSPVSPTCDIILVHGLNGGCAKTWQHTGTGNIWCRDYLPFDVIDCVRATNARIWTYGYNANVAFQAAAGASVFSFAYQLLNRVENIREGFEHNKIIWICHSLGGIVVKTALIEACLHDAYVSILRSTVGIIFLGTPHQGSGMANIAEVAARVADTVVPNILFRPNRALVRSLRRDCDGLFETAGRFANICGPIKIYNIHEMLPIGGHLVVERRSALMNIQDEVQIPMNANHSTLCKFKDNNDNNYRIVKDIIQKLMKLTANPGGLSTGSSNAPILQPPINPVNDGVSSSQTHPRPHAGTPILEAISHSAPNPYGIPKTHSAEDLTMTHDEQAPECDSGWICDTCRITIPLSLARVHCLQCEDYDLCTDCFRAGLSSKEHRVEHHVRHIIKSYRLRQENKDLITPGEFVHPYISPGRSQPNWSIEGDLRWHNLHNYNNHARFLSSHVQSGHYLVTFVLEFKLSPIITESRNALPAERSIGTLRLAAGTISTKQRFFRDKYVEDGSLINKLFTRVSYNDYSITTGGMVSVELDSFLHIGSNTSETTEIGFLMQWSDVLSFVGSDEPVIKMSLVEVKLEDLLEYEPQQSLIGSIPRQYASPYAGHVTLLAPSQFSDYSMPTASLSRHDETYNNRLYWPLLAQIFERQQAQQELDETEQLQFYQRLLARPQDEVDSRELLRLLEVARQTP